MTLPAQDNIIKKLIFDIDTAITENTKYVLLEIIQKEFAEKEKYKDEKYKNIFKNFPTINSSSHILYMFMNYNDDKVINMKRYDILSGIETFIEDLTEERTSPQSTLNNTMGQKKLIGSKYIYVDDFKNSTQNQQVKQKKNLKIQNDLSKILLNVWYVVEFFQNNQFIIKHKNIKK